MSPADLRHALQKVKLDLKSTNPSYTLLHSNPGFYYNNKLTTYTYTTRNIFITIQAPIASREAQFYIYTIQSFPVPLHTDRYNKSAGYTKIHDLPTFIAVSTSGNHHFELSLIDYLPCMGENHITCPTTFPISHREQHTCASALFFDVAYIANKLCNIKIHTHATLDTNIQQSQPNSYIVTTLDKTYQSVCEDQILNEKPACVHCQIDQPCGCTLVVDNYEIPPQICHESFPETTTKQLHGVNLPLVINYYPELNHFNLQNLQTDTMSLALPNLTSLVTSFKDVREIDKTLGLKLRQVVSAIERKKTTYFEVPEGEASWLPFTEDPSFAPIFFIVVVCYIILSIPALIYTMWKLRKITTALMIVQKVQMTHGFAITKAPTTPHPTHAPQHPLNEYYGILVFLTILATIATAIQVLTFLKKTKLWQKLTKLTTNNTPPNTLRARQEDIIHSDQDPPCTPLLTDSNTEPMNPPAYSGLEQTKTTPSAPRETPLTPVSRMAGYVSPNVYVYSKYRRGDRK